MSLEQCYWLSRDYYEDACSFYLREAGSDAEDDDMRSAQKDNNGGRRTPVIDADEFRSVKYKKESRTSVRTLRSTKTNKSATDDNSSDQYEID